MKKIKNCSLLFVLICVSGPALATKNIWRDCGIGAAIFTRTGWAAVTSNIIWDLGLTGSFSTSSSESQCAGRSSSAARFIHQNYAVIEEETATGSGSHLVTMLNILGCDPTMHRQIIDAVRSDFSREIQGPSFDKKDQNRKAEGYFNNLSENVETRFMSFCRLS